MIGSFHQSLIPLWRALATLRGASRRRPCVRFACGAAFASAAALPAQPSPQLIQSDPNRTVAAIALGDFSQTGAGGVFAAWVHDDPSAESLLRFHQRAGEAWAREQIAAFTDVGTTPTDSPTPPILLAAGDYSNDGKTDLTVAVNSFNTTTSLRHYQRANAGFSPDDDSEANVLTETGAGRRSTFWQALAIGDLLADGVPTLVSSDINFFEPYAGHAAPLPALGFGPQRITLHRRAGAGAFGAQSSVSDLEYARENSEETTLAVGDISGDGFPEVLIVENIWNRSPGWGHQLSVAAMSANGGDDAGSFVAGDVEDFFDDPVEFAPNALLSVDRVIRELFWSDAHGQMGVTAVAIAGADDLTRDGIADLAVARFDSYDGEPYGNPPFPATAATNGHGVLEVRQVPFNGEFLGEDLRFDIEDYGPWRWTSLHVADTDGDGAPELIAAAEDLESGLWHLWRYVWDKGGFINNDGAPSAAFPDGDYHPPAPAALLNSATRTDIIPPAGAAITALGVGNADADDDVEIVYGLDNGELYVLDEAGGVNAARSWMLF